MLEVINYNESEFVLVSRAECIQIASKTFGKDVKVIENSLKCITDRMGYLGDYYVLKILAEDESGQICERNYFVKTPPQSVDEDQHDETTRIFAKEAELYSFLLEKLSNYSKTKWKPECYLARNDILVLEDLKRIGFEHIPQNVPFNLDHMKMFLSSLATFHACSIAYEVETSESIGAQFKDILFETSILKDLDWFRAGITGLQSIASIHPSFQSEDHQNFIRNHFIASLDEVYEMAGESSKFRNVLCHRDTWQNNALFKFENGNNEKPVVGVLVDFQICRYSPPAIDVLFAIYLNTNRKFRDSIIADCIKWYHSKLTIELADMKINIDDHIPWEGFLKSCNYLKLVPVLYNGVAATLVKMPEGYLYELKKIDPLKFAHYRCVSRREILFEIISKDLKFKNCMFEAVEELMEVIYKDSY